MSRVPPALAFRLALLAITLLAAWLRLQQLGHQWLIDDEWHALHKLIHSSGYGPILSSFGRSDYSIPLTLYYRLLADTVGVSELAMRLPLLVCGIAFVPLAMGFARARLGTATAVGFGLLLALSPLLAAFSRMARPYMACLLLAAVALWALAGWARHGRARQALLYAGCTWLASWLHLLLAPFLLAPLGWLLLQRWRGVAGVDVSAGRILALGILLAAAIAGVVLPPLLNDLAAMGERTGADLPQLATLVGVWHMWLGTESILLVVLGLVLAACGWRPLADRAGDVLALWLCGLLAVLLAIVVMRPAWVHNPLTFGRYLLPALPLWLLLMAAGAARLAGWLPARWRAVAVLACCSLPLLGSPWQEQLQRPNDFSLHTYYQQDYRTAHNEVRPLFVPFAAPSAFWAQFRDTAPRTQRIAITGQPDFQSYYNLQPLYQPLHRQTLLNLQTSGACGPDRHGEAFPAQGIFLRTAVSLQAPGELHTQGVDWIVLDRRLAAELKRLQRPWANTYQDACDRYLQLRFGAPAWRDEFLAAWSTATDRGHAATVAALQDAPPDAE